MSDLTVVLLSFALAGIASIWAAWVGENADLRKRRIAVIVAIFALLAGMIKLIYDNNESKKTEAKRETEFKINLDKQNTLLKQDSILLKKQDSVLSEANITLDTILMLRTQENKIHSTIREVEYPAGLPSASVMLLIGLDSGYTELLNALRIDSIHGEFKPGRLTSTRASSELDDILSITLPFVYLERKCHETKVMFAMQPIGGFDGHSVSLHLFFYPDQNALQLSYEVARMNTSDFSSCMDFLPNWEGATVGLEGSTMPRLKSAIIMLHAGIHMEHMILVGECKLPSIITKAELVRGGIQY